MRKHLIKLIITIYVGVLLILPCTLAIAQSDSVAFTVETEEINNDYYQHKYRYLDIVLGENINAIKIAIQPFKPKNYFNFGVLSLQGAYEQKLNESFSLLNEINTTTFWGEGQKLNELGYAIGVRWYALKRSEIQNGQSGNNTNGAYLGFKADNIFNAITNRSTDPKKEISRYVQLNPSPEFSIGYQNKISRLLYIDTNLFFNYSFQTETFGYGITLLLGTSFNINE